MNRRAINTRYMPYGPVKIGPSSAPMVFHNNHFQSVGNYGIVFMPSMVPDCDDPDFRVLYPENTMPAWSNTSPESPAAWEAIEDAKDAELDAWIAGLGLSE